jgi:hypothetical protein
MNVPVGFNTRNSCWLRGRNYFIYIIIWIHTPISLVRLLVYSFSEKGVQTLVW